MGTLARTLTKGRLKTGDVIGADAQIRQISDLRERWNARPDDPTEATQNMCSQGQVYIHDPLLNQQREATDSERRSVRSARTVLLSVHAYDQICQPPDYAARRLFSSACTVTARRGSAPVAQGESVVV